MNMPVKKEYYKLRRAAQDRVVEINNSGGIASFYHGHREWVVQIFETSKQENV